MENPDRNTLSEVFGQPAVAVGRYLALLLLLAIAGSLLLTSSANANYRKLTKQGNKALAEDKPDEALKLYKEAEVEKPQQPILDYDIGAALYKQDKYPDALQRFTRALNTDDAPLQADAWYNSGNTLFRAQRYAEAINAYKKSLEINPDDIDAKYNLELSRAKLKEQAQKQNQQQDQQQQQPQDKQDQQNQQDQQKQQDQQNQQNQQDQQNQQSQQQQDKQQQQDQQNQQGDQNQEQQQSQQMQDKQNQQNQQDQQQQQEQQDSTGSQADSSTQQQQQQKRAQAQQKQGMSKQDAERILNAIAGDDKNLQKHLAEFKLQGSEPNRSGKDW